MQYQSATRLVLAQYQCRTSVVPLTHRCRVRTAPVQRQDSSRALGRRFGSDIAGEPRSGRNRIDVVPMLGATGADLGPIEEIPGLVGLILGPCGADVRVDSGRIFVLLSGR